MSLLLDFSIIINNIGLLIIYLRIISDVLIGNDQYLGIITEFMHKGLLTRPEFTVGLITFLVLFPLCSLERMDSLAAASTSGLMLALSFSVITIAMAIIEISKNGLQGVAWQPNPKYFSGNLLEGLIVVIGVFPVIFTSLVCHYNLLHVKEDLPLRHRNKIGKIVNLAGGGCITLYILVASFGYILFKDDVQGDVLLNFNCKSLEPLVGSHGCIVVAVLVRSMYAITLVSFFPSFLFFSSSSLRGGNNLGVLPFLFRMKRQQALTRSTLCFAGLIDHDISPNPFCIEANYNDPLLQAGEQNDTCALDEHLCQFACCLNCCPESAEYLDPTPTHRCSGSWTHRLHDPLFAASSCGTTGEDCGQLCHCRAAFLVRLLGRRCHHLAAVYRPARVTNFIQSYKLSYYSFNLTGMAVVIFLNFLGVLILFF